MSRKSVSDKMSLKEEIVEQINNNQVVMYSKTSCPFCVKAKNALKRAGLKNWVTVELDRRSDGGKIQDIMRELTKAKTVPRVFINGKCVGGGDDVDFLERSGKLAKLLNNDTN